MHNCPVCHASLCRHLNAAININNRGAHGLKAQLMSSNRSHARCPRCMLCISVGYVTSTSWSLSKTNCKPLNWRSQLNQDIAHGSKLVYLEH
ncbi:hypothetical protein CEN44_17205 [Fischerella muscicola CCMEE 5323]|uniref:Uncharacterized protein n=1 Tax=Fischerella muscicola CCMEE 5323 TaxID=2019572 RepID=A0A2N6K0G0_FISMU|nr:hypothetical protein CEN44_17205 [Fischerella muscicola CCMEE 5323]